MAFELTPKSLRKICRDNKLCVPRSLGFPCTLHATHTRVPYQGFFLRAQRCQSAV